MNPRAQTVLHVGLACFALLALHCGGANDDVVFAPSDGGPAIDGGSATDGAMAGTSSGSTGAPGPSAEGGAKDDDASASPADAGGSCKATGAPCTGGRTCLCCGGGASEVCMCTVACKNDGECPYSTHSLCNKAKGQQMGICTPRDLTCGQ